uniref:Uncharacterized protein n=2 Tax=Oryza meridionalis TaxID=40149 RepID=A0A0E0CC62_9ORYZ
MWTRHRVVSRTVKTQTSPDLTPLSSQNLLQPAPSRGSAELPEAAGGVERLDGEHAAAAAVTTKQICPCVTPGCRDERHGAILPVQGHPRLCGCCGAQAVEANMRHHPMMTRRRLIGPQHSRT